MREASLITGINRAYFQGMLDRNPEVAQRAVLAEMPYGGSEADHEFIRRQPRPAKLFSSHTGKFNLVYAGAMLPKAYAVLDRLLDGLADLRKTHPHLACEFHLHFIGTGKSPSDPEGYNIRPYLERRGLLDCASEHPARLPYLDVLTHLHAASGVLVLGSTEAHYSPSKIYQAILSRRPVLAILHEASTAIATLRTANAGPIMTMSARDLPSATAVASELDRFIFANTYSETQVQWESLEEHSARSSARALATALDKVLLRSVAASP